MLDAEGEDQTLPTLKPFSFGFPSLRWGCLRPKPDFALPCHLVEQSSALSSA